MIPTTLLEAYKATCYEIIDPKVAIYIGQENEVLQTFLKENEITNWCFITAWNPFSKALSLQENKELNMFLEADLDGYSIFPGEGKDTIADWPPEISFFVGNITREQAIVLGEKYEQNGIVFGMVDELPELIVLVQ